ncbi:organomercurial lyase [Streptomyces sp. WAC00263]|uniref:organomercurial lyase n=1 Tax=Streptomyces sp. WAC00263 TaxID=1917422 RepID=UPI001F510B45|nr:organomercurial lyase [Streptomyces sp. WAC00263]
MPVTPAGLAQGDPGRGSPPSSATPPRSPSPCQATGDPVRLTATPDGPTNVEPATAVESIVTPDAPSTVRASFCNQFHFFAGVGVGARVLPVAYGVERPLIEQIRSGTAETGCC